MRLLYTVFYFVQHYYHVFVIAGASVPAFSPGPAVIYLPRCTAFIDDGLLSSSAQEKQLPHRQIGLVHLPGHRGGGVCFDLVRGLRLPAGHFVHHHKLLHDSLGSSGLASSRPPCSCISFSSICLVWSACLSIVFPSSRKTRTYQNAGERIAAGSSHQYHTRPFPR